MAHNTKSRTETITERGDTPSETFEHITKEKKMGIFNQIGKGNETVLQDSEQKE